VKPLTKHVTQQHVYCTYITHTQKHTQKDIHIYTVPPRTFTYIQTHPLTYNKLTHTVGDHHDTIFDEFDARSLGEGRGRVGLVAHRSDSRLEGGKDDELEGASGR
jgi:hypothetical protein